MTTIRSLALFLILTLAASAAGAALVQSIAETGDTPTASDNDYTRINDALQAATNGETVTLQGVFDWTEANAMASWALGSDGIGATADDYYVTVPSVDDLTITAATLGDATIQGPGDLPGVDLEGAIIFLAGSGDSFLNLAISNLTILDFDLPLGMFHNGGPTTAFNGATVTNNHIRVAVDLMGSFSLPAGEPFQNIGLHYAFGTNQTISNNVIEIPGDALSDRSDPDSANHQLASTVAMQSNTSGGAVYDGLLIDGNEIRILNAQSADPEVIYGIWENGHAHTSNITVSNNRFLNLAAGNDPALNVQNAFRVTSHSSGGTTVTYSGNEVRGANLGLAQYTSTSPPDYSAQDPVQVTANTFLDNATAVIVRSSGKDVLRCNRFFGNDVAIDNEGALSDADAAENWFGCNAGPGFGTCDTIGVNVDVPFWITMGLTSNKATLNAGETATVTADLKRNSSGGLTSCDVPDGATTLFDAAGGTVAPEVVDMTNGLSPSTFTAGGESVLASVSALIDGQVEVAFIPVTATETDLSVFKYDYIFLWEPGGSNTWVIRVRNHGPSSVVGASLQDTLPALLANCTWTCTPEGNGSCTAAGAGDLDETFDLAAGASLRFDVSCTFPAVLSDDEFVNTATVSVPAGMTDTDPSDNSSTDGTYSPLVGIFGDGFESGDFSKWSSSTP